MSVLIPHSTVIIPFMSRFHQPKHWLILQGTNLSRNRKHQNSTQSWSRSGLGEMTMVSMLYFIQCTMHYHCITLCLVMTFFSTSALRKYINPKNNPKTATKTLRKIFLSTFLCPTESQLPPPPAPPGVPGLSLMIEWTWNSPRRPGELADWSSIYIYVYYIYTWMFPKIVGFPPKSSIKK